MSRSRDKNEDEHIRGENRQLKKENQQLRKRLKQLEKNEHVYRDFKLNLLEGADGDPEELPTKPDCKDCGKGVLIRSVLDLGPFVYDITNCPICGESSRKRR